MFLSLFFSNLMEILKICTLNMNGARDRGKRSVLLEYAQQKNMNVLFTVRICVFRPVKVSVLFKFQSVSRMRVTSQNPCVRTACFS